MLSAAATLGVGATCKICCGSDDVRDDVTGDDIIGKDDSDTLSGCGDVAAGGGMLFRLSDWSEGRRGLFGFWSGLAGGRRLFRFSVGSCGGGGGGAEAVRVEPRFSEVSEGRAGVGGVTGDTGGCGAAAAGVVRVVCPEASCS